MKRILLSLLGLMLVLGMTACGSGQTSSSSVASTPAPESSTASSSWEETDSPILVAYYDGESGGRVRDAAELLQETLGSELLEIEEEPSGDFSAYEFVLLGFAAQNNTLPQAIQDFLSDNDLGARTIYPFVTGQGNEADAIFFAISQLQPGALLGDSALLFSTDTSENGVTEWAENLGLAQETLASESSDTVASATVVPDQQQVFTLWEEGNAPATTEYTVNNGGYSDDPDFRPYLTSFPVPERVQVKGAVLICPGGAFQFRSDQPEGIDVAEALSARGYQSFVVDYRLRPYTQQEGALDLARAVRFVRAHAQDYGFDPKDIAVMGFSAGGILSGEMLLNFDGNVLPTDLDPDYQLDELDEVSADAAACGMIYSFYGRLSVGTTDVELLRSGDLPPTFYCYGTRDPFYEQFLANADAAEEAGVSVERLQLDEMPHGFGAEGGWIPAYDAWLEGVFQSN